ADIDALFQRRANLDPFDALNHRLDETVVDTLGDDDAAGCGATLPSRIEGALGRQLDRGVEVGIIQNDLRVLAAHFQLDLGLACHASRRDTTADTHRAGKTDAIDAPVVDQNFTDLAALAHYQVENSGWEARTRNDLRDGPGTTWHQVGRLDHHAIAVRERRRDLPGRNRDREIPGRDQTDHPKRLTRDFDAHPRAYRLQDFARLAQTLTGEELEDIACARHLADGFGQGLALLTSQQRTQLLAPGEDVQTDLFQRIGTRLDTAGRPGGKGLARRGNRRFDLSRVGLRILTDDIREIGRIDVGLVLIASYPL